jgi:hypothetical protein
MNETQELLLKLIQEDALEQTPNNGLQVLIFYRALAEFVSGLGRIPEELADAIRLVEGWLFPMIRLGSGKHDLSDKECLEIALGQPRQDAEIVDNVINLPKN